MVGPSLIVSFSNFTDILTIAHVLPGRCKGQWQQLVADAPEATNEPLSDWLIRLRCLLSNWRSCEVGLSHHTELNANGFASQQLNGDQFLLSNRARPSTSLREVPHTQTQNHTQTRKLTPTT